MDSGQWTTPFQIGLIVVFNAFCLTALLSSFCRSRADIERVVSGSKILTRLNNICKSIPVFPGARYTGKQMRGNSEIASVEFQFKKSPIVDAEVERFYEEWAEENQWEQFEKNEFRKDNQTVIIGFGRLIETNYQIGCMEPR